MPCTPFNLPGGGRGFICSRTPRPRCACGLQAWQLLVPPKETR